MEGVQRGSRGAWRGTAGIAQLPTERKLRLGGLRELGERVPANGDLRHPDRISLPARIGRVEGSRREEESPSAPRPSGFATFFYAYSLGIALAGLFIASFVLHLWGSYRAAVAEAALHGGPQHSLMAHLGDMGFWFESFQNWQSEFLATAALVVLSIVLRFRGSPESKHVNASNAETGR